MSDPQANQPVPPVNNPPVEKEEGKINSQLNQMKSSTELQICIYYDQVFSCFYFVFCLILYIFKGYILPFSPKHIGNEISGIFFYFIIQFTRLRIGSNGNKTETAVYLFYYAILGIPVLVSYVYYIKLQTYVLVFDVVLNAIGLIFIIVESLMSIKAIISVKSHDKPI